MAPCNYIRLDTAEIDCSSLYLDDLFDMDILCTEEGIFFQHRRTSIERTPPMAAFEYTPPDSDDDDRAYIRIVDLFT